LLAADKGDWVKMPTTMPLAVVVLVDTALR